MAIDPDLDRRGRLVRSLGALREMLPGSFVERAHKCGRSNCRCADGKQLHTSFQLSVLIQGKPNPTSAPHQRVGPDYGLFSVRGATQLLWFQSQL